MGLELFNNIIKNVKESEMMQNFMEELKKTIEKNNELNNTEKYSNYWQYKNFMEDELAASIGISRWATDNTFKKELKDAIEGSMLELSKKEGVLYRKKFSGNGPSNNKNFLVDKFENGQIEHINIKSNKIPIGYEKEDIIFQYNANGNAEVRTDLKTEILQIAKSKVMDLKLKEIEKANKFKIEGHIYEVFEDDGYIFLNDITEKKDCSFEDIDFVVNCYEGEGEYQVINGEYTKIN